MKKQLTLIAMAFLIGMSGLMAQSANRNCGTMNYLQQQLKNDPAMKLRMQQIEDQTAYYARTNTANKNAMVVTIPVVFHILYSTNNATQNISDARIMEQLNVLNKDFSRTNADAGNTPSVFQGVAANTGIQFCLAVRSPSGTTTTGIIRKQTATTSFVNDDVKFNSTGGDDAWPTASYLNIWVCNLGGGLLGYAQFPGGPANTDGVVLLNGSVGGPAAPGTSTPYHLGRTATHEVGHWLNLRHIWGDANCGSDLVNDTPTQQTSNFGCPSFPHVTCSNGPNGDMFMNYMDYTDDACMNMFTAGQSTRSNALLVAGGARVGLASSLGCVPVGGGCGTPTGLSATSITQTSATLNWSAVPTATDYQVYYRVAGTTTWTPTNTTNTSKALTGLTASTTYEYRVSALCPSGYSPYSVIQTFTTLAAGGCGTPTGLAALNIQQTSAAINWLAVAGATSYKVQYRVNGTTTWTTKSSTTSPKVITSLLPGTVYNYRVRAVCSGVNSTYTSILNFTTLPSGGNCTGIDNYEPNDTKGLPSAILINTDAYPLISTPTDKDYFKFSTTVPAPKIKITVDGLPADYDVILYQAVGGAQLAISQNGGTTAEQIIYNAASNSSYKVYVYGYNGAYNATSCYHIKVNTSANPYREMGTFSSRSDKPGAMSLYPNPAIDQLKVTLLSDEDQISTINIVDLVGRTVLSSQEELSEGSNELDLDLSNVQKGVYTVQVTINGTTLMQKLVIQK